MKSSSIWVWRLQPPGRYHCTPVIPHTVPSGHHGWSTCWPHSPWSSSLPPELIGSQQRAHCWSGGLHSTAHWHTRPPAGGHTDEVQERFHRRRWPAQTASSLQKLLRFGQMFRRAFWSRLVCRGYSFHTTHRLYQSKETVGWHGLHQCCHTRLKGQNRFPVRQQRGGSWCWQCHCWGSAEASSRPH